MPRRPQKLPPHKRRKLNPPPTRTDPEDRNTQETTQSSIPVNEGGVIETGGEAEGSDTGVATEMILPVREAVNDEGAIETSGEVEGSDTGVATDMIPPVHEAALKAPQLPQSGTLDTRIQTGCGFCGKTGDLTSCSQCRIMFYCSPKHESAHRLWHRSACTAIKNPQSVAGHEEETPCPGPGSFLGGIAKEIPTVISIKIQLDHLMEVLKKSRDDRRGIRYIIPPLMLGLDDDQECYDFIKWWTEVRQNPDYNLADPKLRYLSISNADVFEPVDYLCKDYPELSFIVSATLLKSKLLLDLASLEDSSSTVAEQVPRKVLDISEPSFPLSPVVAEIWDLLGQEKRRVLIGQLHTQIDMLIRAVEKCNVHFWRFLLYFSGRVTVHPDASSQGSVGEMLIVLMQTYEAWVETPGALELIAHLYGEIGQQGA